MQKTGLYRVLGVCMLCIVCTLSAPLSACSSTSANLTENPAPITVDTIDKHIALENRDYTLDVRDLNFAFGSVIQIVPSDTPYIEVSYAKTIDDAGFSIDVVGDQIIFSMERNKVDENYFYCTVGARISTFRLRGTQDVYWDCESMDSVSMVATIPKEGISAKKNGGIPTISISNMECNTASFNLSGPATWSMSGTATDAEFNVSGMAAVRASNLECNRASVSLADEATMGIRVLERIVCNVASEAELTVHGDAQVAATGTEPILDRDTVEVAEQDAANAANAQEAATEGETN